MLCEFLDVLNVFWLITISQVLQGGGRCLWIMLIFSKFVAQNKHCDVLLTVFTWHNYMGRWMYRFEFTFCVCVHMRDYLNFYSAFLLYNRLNSHCTVIVNHDLLASLISPIVISLFLLCLCTKTTTVSLRVFSNNISCPIVALNKETLAVSITQGRTNSTKWPRGFARNTSYTDTLGFLNVMGGCYRHQVHSHVYSTHSVLFLTILFVRFFININWYVRVALNIINDK